MKSRFATLALLFALSPLSAFAQLNSVFSDLFSTLLNERLSLSLGTHAGHFRPASDLAVWTLTPTLNSLISSNIASFPLSSTAVGVTFDFSSGQPVSVLGSQGPILAERATTLGKGRITVGINATHLSLNRLRGMPLDEIRFTFPHQDLGNVGLGDNPTEIDVIDVYMGLNVDADIVAMYATYGVTRNLDVSVAVPLVRVAVDGTAHAVIDSRTITRFGQALHIFGGDSRNPILATDEDYSGSATGLGDVALRAKYSLPIEAAYGLAALLDVRLPTGNEEDFLGNGSPSFRLSVIGSAMLGGFSPHLNVGYDVRSTDTSTDSSQANVSDFDREAIVFLAGFDHQLAERVTLALDLIGNVATASSGYDLLPGSVAILDGSQVSDGGSALREVNLSNVPENIEDDTLDLSLGLRIAFSEQFQVLGNVLVALNDGGLRSSVAPTLGASFSF